MLHGIRRGTHSYTAASTHCSYVVQLVTARLIHTGESHCRHGLLCFFLFATFSLSHTHTHAHSAKPSSSFFLYVRTYVYVSLSQVQSVCSEHTPEYMCTYTWASTCKVGTTRERLKEKVRLEFLHNTVNVSGLRYLVCLHCQIINPLRHDTTSKDMQTLTPQDTVVHYY